MFIGRTQWEPVEMFKPTQVANLKQCPIPGEQKENIILINDRLAVGELVSKYSLHSSPV